MAINVCLAGKVYLFMVTILVMDSQNRWFLQMTKHAVRVMCSYQHTSDAPNAIGGHTRLGATLLMTYCVACAPFGTW